VAIRSNHAVWLPRGQTVWHNQFMKNSERVFSDGVRQNFATFLEIIFFGEHAREQFWELTTSPRDLANGTWYNNAYSNLKYYQVGNLYGLRVLQYAAFAARMIQRDESNSAVYFAIFQSNL